MGGTALALTLCGGAAFAETPGGSEVQELVVTAQKREQLLQDVPASITAFSSEMLESRQLDNVQDFMSLVPSLVYTKLNGVDLIAIRGIAPDTNNATVDPSAAQHIDGVYQPRVTNMNLMLADLASVEVLRGPQGTLYGRNATAGVINYVLKKPTESLEYGGSVTVGNYAAVQVKAYISGPLLPNLTGRLSILSDRHSGYSENLFTGERLDDGHVEGVRGALRWRPDEKVTVDLSAYRTYSRAAGPQNYAFSPLVGPDIDRFAPVSRLYTLEPWKVYVDQRPLQKISQLGLTATTTFEPSESLNIRSITGYIHSRYGDVRDTEPSAAPLSVGFSDYDAETFSQELNANLKVGRFDAVFGAYYLRDDADQRGYIIFPNGIVARNIPSTSIALMPQLAKTRAVFGDVTFSVTDDLRLLGGIRLNKDTKDVVQTSIQPPLTASCTNLKQSLSYTSTTGKVGAQYDISPDIMAYGQWQSGFKAGGFNFVCGDSFNPERVKSYEAGVKAVMFDRRLRLNLSVFSANISDLQVTQLVLINNVPSSRVENAASSRNRGIELESSTQLSGNFRIDLTAAYNDAKYRDYVSFNTFTRKTIDLRGFQVTKTPKLTFNIGAEYARLISEKCKFTLRGDWYRSGKIWYTPYHEKIASQPDAYSLFNVYAKVEPEGSPLAFSAYVKNLSNRAVRLSGQTSAQYSNGRGAYNDPRTFGVGVSGKF